MLVTLNDDCTRAVTQHLQTVTIEREESVTNIGDVTSHIATKLLNIVLFSF